jgi:hypothetical protein
VGVPEDDVCVAEAQARGDLPHAAQAGAAQLAAGEVGFERPQAGAVERGDGEREGTRQRAGAQHAGQRPEPPPWCPVAPVTAIEAAAVAAVIAAAASPAVDTTTGGLRGLVDAAQRAPGADGRAPVERVAGGGLAGDGVDPGEDWFGDGLVVFGAREGARGAAHDTAHRADPEAFERGDREVAVEVVPVGGVDVGAHPQAGVGGGEAGRGGPGSELREHWGRVVRREALLDAERKWGGLLAATRQPRLDERVIVVAGEHDDFAPGERAAEVLEEWARGGERVAARPVAQLEDVAEQHEPIDVAQRLQQHGAQLGAAQDVDA